MPQVAVTVAFGFVLLSVALFIRYIHHVANLIRVATIIDVIHAESSELLERRWPGAPPQEEPDPQPGAACRVVCAPRSGVVVSVNEHALVDLATEFGCVIALVPRLGDFLPRGAPLLSVHPDGLEAPAHDGGEVDDRLSAAVSFDTERTAEQDVAFGFRQLVDIAERALSPGVNDPTTAVQAIDALHDLLRQVVIRRLPSGRHADQDGTLRLIVPQYRVEDFLALVIGEILRYGADAAQVPTRLRGMLADLTTTARPEHRPPLAYWSARIAPGSTRRTEAGEIPTRPE